MNRKDFLFSSSGLLLSLHFTPFAIGSRDKMQRLAMGTVLFRNRFAQTKPEQVQHIKNELTLLKVPSYYKERFGVNQLEFWSYHFESLDTNYLRELKQSMTNSGSRLVNIQMDGPVDYDLASRNESYRKESLALAKKWMDAAAFLDSECIRINPGSTGGSLDNSIESMKEVNAYAKSKGLVLLTENHFGIEMDTDLHLKINRAAGSDNIYTLPDFGNYPVETMYESLEKILPYAYLISAKAAAFSENIEHISFDFDRCVKMAENAGFKGIYSVEQWSPGYQDFDFEKVADWLIEHVSENISA